MTYRKQQTFKRNRVAKVALREGRASVYTRISVLDSAYSACYFSAALCSYMRPEGLW